MKKGLWNEKELKLLLWALMLYSDHQGRKIDELVKRSLILSDFNLTQKSWTMTGIKSPNFFPSKTRLDAKPNGSPSRNPSL